MAEALAASLACGQFDINVSAAAVGGWNPLTPATTRSPIERLRCGWRLHITCSFNSTEMLQKVLQ